MTTDGFETRLRLALDRERMDLGALAAVFSGAAAGDIAAIVRARPHGPFARRVWYLYEWLTGESLDVPQPSGRLRFVPLLDPTYHVALAAGTPSPRHRVIDNLPGTRRFCPMVRWTPALRFATTARWPVRARRILSCLQPAQRRSVAESLRQSEARSSFILAGEQPCDVRSVRWADAIAQAGSRALTIDELVRMQRLAHGGPRFERFGLRRNTSAARSGGRDGAGDSGGARPADLEDLVGGLIDYAERAVSGGVDPVIAAAALAFGFRSIRPFARGNGHLHRWLVHHTLHAAGYTPPDFVLPVSAAMVRRLDACRDVAPRPAPLDAGPWRHTADAYRFPDMTAHAEFLYTCLEDAVDGELRSAANEAGI
jgi:Fic/DOC family